MEEKQLPQNEADSNSKEVLPPGVAKDIRKLSHDLSNALEIVVQTSYLLSTVELREPATEWLKMLDEGVAKALDLNNSLRSTIRHHSAP